MGKSTFQYHLPVWFRWKETYANNKVLMKKICYEDHQWHISVDLKVDNDWAARRLYEILLFPMWMGQPNEGEALPWKAMAIPRRKVSWSEECNTSSFSQRDNKYLPQLHIKLGLIKIFVKAMNKEGERFELLGQKFPPIIEAKVREDIFVGPQVKQLFQDPHFKNKLNTVERTAWDVFGNVWSNFLACKKSEKYIEIVEDLPSSHRALGRNMLLKLHFLQYHLEIFSLGNIETVSDEHDERFHQDIFRMEKRCTGKWSPNMLGDHC